MIRRLFWLGLGLGTGTTVGLLGARWFRRKTAALAPANLGRQAATRVRTVGALLQDAGREFRRGMEEKEVELRPVRGEPA